MMRFTSGNFCPGWGAPAALDVTFISTRYAMKRPGWRERGGRLCATRGSVHRRACSSPAYYPACTWLFYTTVSLTRLCIHAGDDQLVVGEGRGLREGVSHHLLQVQGATGLQGFLQGNLVQAAIQAALILLRVQLPHARQLRCLHTCTSGGAGGAGAVVTAGLPTGCHVKATWGKPLLTTTSSIGESSGQVQPSLVGGMCRTPIPQPTLTCSPVSLAGPPNNGNVPESSELELSSARRLLRLHKASAGEAQAKSTTRCTSEKAMVAANELRHKKKKTKVVEEGGKKEGDGSCRPETPHRAYQ